MGPTRTLPPDRQATPRTQRQLVNDPLDLDQPSATPPEPSTSAEGQTHRTAPRDGTREQRDAVTDLAVPEPIPYRADVIGSRSQPPEPLGRRTPEPLDAAREAVER